jgi:hypothetical protein
MREARQGIFGPSLLRIGGAAMARHKLGLLAAAVGLLAAIAGCSSGGTTGAGTLPGFAPSSGHLAPQESPTPPVSAPVTIPYPYTNTWTTTTWTGPTAKPVMTKGRDDGTTTVEFTLDRNTGTYDVIETIKSLTGYTEVLNSAIGFLDHAGGIAQIILSDNYSYVDGPFVETGMDTYPTGENSFDFPLVSGRTWSAAARHVSYVNQHQSGQNAFSENTSYTEAADGTYRGQTSFSEIHGKKNQDNYASTTSVALKAPSVYILSERAGGYNQLTQTFELPNANHIEVVSSGKKPLPFKPGRVEVPDWYPGHGPLPSALYSDNFHVVGLAREPASCGKRAGELSSEVIEEFANVDPVQGFYNTYQATYYLSKLAKGQYWFSCIVERYVNAAYANDWVMSAGDWGKLSSRQIGTEILIARGAEGDARMLPQAMGGVQILTFPPALFHPRQLVSRT